VANILAYITKRDAEIIRQWLNLEPCIVWIVKREQTDHEYTWQALDVLPEIQPQAYSLWHRQSGELNIPSGSVDVPDKIVADPYAGWTQRLDTLDATTPWFGRNLPGPYHFRFAEMGKEAPGSIARSDFSWLGDYFRPIGQGASVETRAWWRRLGRFVRKNSTAIPWPFPQGVGRSVAFAFPDAYSEIRRGRRVDANP
jgi:hypothetical protein